MAIQYTLNDLLFIIFREIITMQNINHSSSEQSIIMHITGKVQGVGFRFFTCQKALSLKLVGYVKNLTNGQVEVLAIGKEYQINQLVQWIKLGGPSSASITDYTVSEVEPNKHYSSFNVKY